MNKLRKLTEKLSNQELVFAKDFLKHGNKVKAYAKAYPNDPNPEKTAYNYYRRVGVHAFIKESQKMTAEKTVIDRQWVIDQLAENARLAKEGVETVTTVTKDGEEVSQTVTKKVELANANKATELLGKTHGMFTDTVTVNGLQEVVKELKDDGDALASQLGGSETDDTDAE